MSQEQLASLDGSTSPAATEMDFAVGMEEDILDYERSSSPEADNGTETTQVCDFENTPISPILSFLSIKNTTSVGEPNISCKDKNEEEGNDNDQSSVVPASGTAADLQKPGYSPKVTINLDSLVTADILNSTLQADGSELDGEYFATAPPSPVLNINFPKVSFVIRKEDPDSNGSKMAPSPFLSMRTPKLSYKAPSSMSRNAVPVNLPETDVARGREAPMLPVSPCSPKVSFNPSSLIFPSDPQTASGCFGGCNPDAARKVMTVRLDPSGPLGSCSASGLEGELPSADNTSTNLDSDASKVCLKNAAQMKLTECVMAQKEKPLEAKFSPCSPKVTFNPSSLIFSSDPQRASECFIGRNPNAARKVMTVRLDPSGPLKSCSVSGPEGELPSADNTSTNSDSDASKVCLQNAAPMKLTESVMAQNKKTPETKYSPCSPKVTFNPSSLIFSGLQAASKCLESPERDVPVQVNTNVSFDPTSLLENLSVSSSDDELQLPPADTSKNWDSDQLAVCDTPNNGFQAVENRRPSSGLRGILKLKKVLSPNEKIVTDCLKLLCETANDDRHQVRDMIRSSAKEVFKNLCFEQFFHKGECISSSCDDNHNYRCHSFPHADEELWNASLFVICQAAMPNLQVVENLVQHFTATGSTVRCLLLAKCIPKVKIVEGLELAHFIVNKLSDTIPVRDVITVILMLNFSDLSSPRYNVLMEGLGVFEQNTTYYSELMAFLNFHGHQLPARFLVKLMEDSMKYSGKGSFVESVSGFLRRLHPSKKNEIQPTASDFEEKFGIRPAADQNEYGEDREPPQKRSKTAKKRVIFAAVPDVREFEVAECPREVQLDTEDPEFSDDECEDDDEPIPNFCGFSEPREEIVGRVFGGLCCSLILQGHCSNTICNLTHDFTKDSFSGVSSEDVQLAADFLIDQSKAPPFEILKIFIEFLAESTLDMNEVARVLKFRKFSLKLSSSDSLKLTRMVLSVLSKQIGLWEAIEKVLVPIPVELEDPEDGRFLFDKELIHFILAEANKNKSSVLRCVRRAIMEQIAMLPQASVGELATVTSSFMEKFVMTGRELSKFPDILPVVTTQPSRFASELKVALYHGVPSKYFTATIMMKPALNTLSRDIAVDVLYTFLLSHYDRARVLTHLFENCRYLDRDTNSSVRQLFGTVALKTAVRLYESEKFAGTAEMFTILDKFNVNLMLLLEKYRENVTELDLATIYCSVKVDTVDRKHVISLFLTHCVNPLISTGSACPPALIKLTAKLFTVFTSGLLVEETLELYKGITSRQKSLVRPFNIVEFVEPTLRCTFNRLCDPEIRKESLKLYLDVVDSETPVTLQKVTHRSMFLIALMFIHHASQKFEVKGHINVIHPVINKMLITCIKEGVYFDLRSSDMAIYSSMTAKEIEVYMLWWFFIYVRARKRAGCDYFNPITVRILQDCIQDDSRLPLHPSLRSVDVSVTGCTERVTLVIRNSIAQPIAIIAGSERGVFELHPATVRAMSQTACNIMLQHGYITAEVDRMCTFCFDKLPVHLAERFP